VREQERIKHLRGVDRPSSTPLRGYRTSQRAICRYSASRFSISWAHLCRNGRQKPAASIFCVLLSTALLIALVTKQNGSRSAFSSRLSGGDGGELNSPSKRTHRRMYYRLSQCFALRFRLPPTGFSSAGPLVLDDD
jgi:hypothetical protein